eukprot:11913922-Alexandrium_andersonii.AAC.1
MAGDRVGQNSGLAHRAEDISEAGQPHIVYVLQPEIVLFFVPELDSTCCRDPSALPHTGADLL